MKVSEHGIKLIEAREGIVLKGYKDSKGLLTVGCGHLVRKGEPYKLHQPIAQAECDRLLAEDLGKVEDAINDAVNVDLTQNQFDALSSLAINIGTGGFARSTVVRKLNKEDYTGAAKAILLWNQPPEIRGRRNGEYKQFLTPDPISAVASVPETVIPAATTDDNSQSPDAQAGSDDTQAQPTPFVAETKEVTAPASDNVVAKTAGMTIGGYAVPGFIVTAIAAGKSLMAQGFIDAKSVGDAALSFITNNTKYVFAGLGLVVLSLILSKLYKQISFFLQMYINARPDMHDIVIKKQ